MSRSLRERERLLFEVSSPGREGIGLPEPEFPDAGDARAPAERAARRGG